jgi:hypothetical protein
MNKLELIKEFNKYHPGYGVEWGYSTYVGGVADTGYWLHEVLINESEDILKLRLEELEHIQKKSDERNRERLKEYERVKSLPPEEQKEYYINQRKQIDEEFRKMFQKYENYLMWGENKIQ